MLGGGCRVVEAKEVAEMEGAMATLAARAAAGEATAMAMAVATVAVERVAMGVAVWQ